LAGELSIIPVLPVRWERGVYINNFRRGEQ